MISQEGDRLTVVGDGGGGYDPLFQEKAVAQLGYMVAGAVGQHIVLSVEIPSLQRILGKEVEAVVPPEEGLEVEVPPGLFRRELPLIGQPEENGVELAAIGKVAIDPEVAPAVAVVAGIADVEIALVIRA